MVINSNLNRIGVEAACDGTSAFGKRQVQNDVVRQGDPTKELGVYPLHPHLDLGNDLENKVGDTNEVVAAQRRHR